MNSTALCFAVASAILFTASPALAYTVIIDPGHGGKDAGASPAHALEKSLTLDTCQRLAGELQRRGIPYVFTRTSDRFIALSARRDVSKRYRDSVFVSIHFNASPNTSAQGIETFYRSANSRGLATAVQTALIRHTRASNRGVKNRGFTVITNNTARAAILVEGGFLTHAAERRRCMTSSYRQSLAQAVTEGIVQTMGANQQQQQPRNYQYAQSRSPQYSAPAATLRAPEFAAQYRYTAPAYNQPQPQQHARPQYRPTPPRYGNMMVILPESASNCRPERTPFGLQNSCRINRHRRR